MGLAAVDAAVTARLAALWTRCPVRTINGTDGDVPKKPSAFLSVEYTVPAGGGNMAISATVITRYWRAQFVNGGTNGAANVYASATAN